MYLGISTLSFGCQNFCGCHLQQATSPIIKIISLRMDEEVATKCTLMRKEFFDADETTESKMYIDKDNLHCLSFTDSTFNRLFVTSAIEPLEVSNFREKTPF